MDREEAVERLQAKRQADQEKLEADPAGVASDYLRAYFGSGLAYDDVLVDVRRLASHNDRAIVRFATAVRMSLDLPPDEVDLIRLVAWDANWVLPDPTLDASRAWLEQLVVDLGRVLTETAPEREAASAEAAGQTPDPDPTLTRVKSFVRSCFAAGGPYQEGLDHIGRLLPRYESRTAEAAAAIRAVLDRPEGETDLVTAVRESVSADVAPDPTPEATRAWLERLLSDVEQMLGEPKTDGG